jgi:hypothetical protein
MVLLATGPARVEGEDARYTRAAATFEPMVPLGADLRTCAVRRAGSELRT